MYFNQRFAGNQFVVEYSYWFTWKRCLDLLITFLCTISFRTSFVIKFVTFEKGKDVETLGNKILLHYNRFTK